MNAESRMADERTPGAPRARRYERAGPFALGLLLMGGLASGFATGAWADERPATAPAPPQTSPPERREADPARDGTSTPPAPPRAGETTGTPDWSPVLYVPPSRGQARHTAAGGTRGTARQGDVELAVLAPRDHVALTTRAQPTLYWYLSQPIAGRVDVTVIDDESIDPLLEITLTGPVAAGIHTFDLAAHGLELQPGRVYTWHVAWVQDAERRSSDLLAEGLIERTGVSRELERSLADASARYAPYALSGIWYDAIAELESALADEPHDRRLLLQQVALLEQAELPRVAEYALELRTR